MKEDTVVKLYSADQIENRVNEIAARINADFAHVAELTALTVMKGAFIFAADLLKKITLKTRIEFIELSSYGQSVTSSGKIVIKKEPPKECLADKHILVIEDIIDTGATAIFLQKYLQSQKPSTIHWAVLLHKKHENHELQSLNPDYAAFEAPEEFLVGYGLDHKEYYRNLPFIGYLRS